MYHDVNGFDNAFWDPAPGAAQGAKPHYDTHDVFVLQVTGSKKVDSLRNAGRAAAPRAGF
ncbi:MAG: JmjC domain-containing protein [Candidatus Dormibacteraceae bacterium]